MMVKATPRGNAQRGVATPETSPWPNPAHQHGQHHANQKRNQDEHVEQHVADPDRADGPEIRAEEAEIGRQVIAVLAEECDGIVPGLPGDAAGVEFRLRGRGVAGVFVANDAVQPGADVAAAGHGGEVIDEGEDAQFRQALQHAQIEGRAANACAGKRDAERAHAMRCAVGVAGRGRFRERLLVGK
jgi:hypothetical protein